MGGVEGPAEEADDDDSDEDASDQVGDGVRGGRRETSSAKWTRRLGVCAAAEAATTATAGVEEEDMCRAVLEEDGGANRVCRRQG
jgi:hypothetical protein